MNLRQRLASFSPNKATVLTIGVFDGVHLGHQHLLQQLLRLAQPDEMPAVITFANSPITVLRPDTQVRYITTPEQRTRLLKAQGIQLVVGLEFTAEDSRVTAKDFASLLVETLGMKGLLMGPGAALGQNRQGDINFLRGLGPNLGFRVEEAEPMVLDGSPVQSRRIREAIGSGDVAAGRRLLGRTFSLTGKVVEGHRQGKELGFPTANLEIAPEMIIPGDGIYATWATIDGVRHPSATSIGVRPTFGPGERLVEVYVMDFDANLYGKRLCVEFVRKVRDQENFPNVEALVEQIGRDVADCRLALAPDGGPHAL
ncbi:MAG: riboflavin biosynthesis protein RibF [SAR202 cluster bacterium Io17-Chloro-G9]|nr:MAG: riboflavin biosynthesis protein RibF [SAR202 cluster bacterium Io17-Chloro-G9]